MLVEYMNTLSIGIKQKLVLRKEVALMRHGSIRKTHTSPMSDMFKVHVTKTNKCKLRFLYQAYRSDITNT